MASLDDLLQETRLLAMHAIQKPDGEYFIRRLCRWYSQTFATPLHIVEKDIPIEEVFTHYFEAKYERMEEAEREAEMEEILMTPEERKVRAAAEVQAKIDDDDFLEQTKVEAQAKISKNPALKTMDRALFAEDKGAQLPLIPVMGTNQPLNEQVLEGKNKALADIPQDIKMEFTDDLGDLDNWDVVGPGEIDDGK